MNPKNSRMLSSLCCCGESKGVRQRWLPLAMGRMVWFRLSWERTGPSNERDWGGLILVFLLCTAATVSFLFILNHRAM